MWRERAGVAVGCQFKGVYLLFTPKSAVYPLKNKPNPQDQHRTTTKTPPIPQKTKSNLQIHQLRILANQLPRLMLCNNLPPTSPNQPQVCTPPPPSPQQQKKKSTNPTHAQHNTETNQSLERERESKRRKNKLDTDPSPAR